MNFLPGWRGCTVLPRAESIRARRLRQAAFWLLCLMPLLLAVARGGADIACVGIGVAVLMLVAIDTAWQYVHGVSLSGRALFMGERLTGPLRHANIGNWMLKIGLPMVGIFIYSAAQHRERYRIAFAGVGLLVVM